MQFKHPEFLYLLGFILIPILVHLFQLQKFKKTPFTNVAFLQKLALKTRKSSAIKKWLILTTRILLFTALIFAFSQPYFSNKKATTQQHTFIYLDTSFSLDTNGEKGNLLQNSIKELIENISTKETYSLLTNSNYYTRISSIELKNILLKIVPEANQRSLSEVFLKIETLKNKKTNTLNKQLLISDFQHYKNKKNIDVTNVTSPVTLVQTASNQKNNLAIDRISVNNQGDNTFIINVFVKNQGIAKKNVPISLYNNEEVFAKQTFSISENQETTVSFPIQNLPQFKGKITLDINDIFGFDNSYFFTLNTKEKINVFSVGKSSDYLSKIYTKGEFNFNSSSLKNINYNSLEKQALILLNELDEIPNSLMTFLEKHLKENKSLVVIPSKKINLNSYNSFFNKIKTGSVQNLKKDSLRITDINFKNPFFTNVFSKQIKNFQYPIVKNYYEDNFTKSAALLRFENQKNFISKLFSENGTAYWLSSSIDSKNSNFKNSPLVVPMFYNFGKLSAQLPKTSYTIGVNNLIDIPITLNKDQVLAIRNQKHSFIPLQKTYTSKTTLETNELPITAGFYEITNKNKTLQSLAFNYNRNESNLQFLNLKELIKSQKNLTYSESVTAVFQENKEKNKVTWLWKWFLTLAIVSLVFEILILKFLKP